MGRPAAALLTPLVALGGTAVGVVALFAAQRALAPALVGGPGSTCPQPDCTLGVGVWLIVGGLAALLAALVAGLLLRHPDRPVRRGLVIALCCAAAYLVESIVLWVLV
ncbi:hypothetical protein GCM10011581_15730 [Saccharopolyspora subtropica]|uniref:Uncharacterized protein n=1 Tax=Saccharopolyspora thermophila TaxID=89367 RepID=A0A917NAZ9_9PSEU|nr:hypothetical protein [Saccharopolyspora subtropica]GGI79400.1 hypothetical protein GCM10011581_15730 [Saccharopolyspora subtropica]